MRRNDYVVIVGLRGRRGSVGSVGSVVMAA